MRTLIPTLCLALMLSACSSRENETTPADGGGGAMGSSMHQGGQKQALKGGAELLVKANLKKRVTLSGYAVNAKLGAILIVGQTHVYLKGLHSWPKGYYTGGDKGKAVEVTGVLSEDHGLPVFVPMKGGLAVQGMPVPEGTDLKKASRRWILVEFAFK